MTGFEALLLERVYVAGQKHQVFCAIFSIKDLTSCLTVLNQPFCPIFIVVPSHEVVERCRKDREMAVAFIGLVQKFLTTIDKSVDMVKPFSNSVVLESEMTLQHHVFKVFLGVLIFIETWESQILEAERCQFALD